MEIIRNPTQDQIVRAAKALKEGHLVAFPTETVYGLGADATNENAVRKIYSVKGRPPNHPLIVHISSINHLVNWAVDIPTYAIKLAKKYWPGPLTLILKRNRLAKDFITGSQEKVGLRVPAHPIALLLLHEFEKLGGNAISAPSANRFGGVSPTTALAVKDEIEKFLDKLDFILDGGPSNIGIESTILDCTEADPVILRPGFVTRQMIESEIGKKALNNNSNNTTKTSGLLKTHYSPKAQVYLNNKPQIGDGYLAMSSISTPIGSIRIGSPTTIEDYAKNLYATLRLADLNNLSRISIVLPEGDGLAEAIRDRLKKASGKNGENLI